MAAERPHCVLVGIGAGTGLACAHRFIDAGYKVSMIARSEERLAGFAAELSHATGYRADLAEADEFRETLNRIVEQQGPAKVVLYNASQATFGTYTEIPLEKFERNFRVNAGGLLVTAQVFGPLMVEAGEGAIVVTGNTASLRGKPRYVGWAGTKAAQRILAESLARELGPHGIHVAYVVIDAVIDMPFARRRWKDQTEDFFARPADLADEIFHIAHQPRSAQSFLVELRPFGETW